MLFLPSNVPSSPEMSDIWFDEPQCSFAIVVVALLFAQLWWWDCPRRCIQLLKRLAGDSKAYQLPPGGMGLPFVGELPSILLEKSPDKIFAFKCRKSAMHGEVYCASIPLLGSKRIVVVSGQEAIQWALANENRGLVANHRRAVQNLLGKTSLFSLTGDAHKRYRATMIKFFQLNHLRGYAEIINCIVRNHFKENLTSGEADGKSIILRDELDRIMLKIVFEVLLGQDLRDERIENQFPQFAQLMNTMYGAVAMPPIKLPGNPYTSAMRAREVFRRMVIDIVNDRKERPVSERNDLVAVLLRIEHLDMSDDDIVDMLSLLIFAGRETSTSALTFTIKFLNENPEFLARVRAEHLALRARKENHATPLLWEDVESLTFTNQAIFESLRLVPFLASIPRVATEDLVYKNYIIPKGYNVWIDVKSLHYDVSHYQNPRDFNPDRFEGHNIKSIMSLPALKPFGGGARLCLGYRLALLQMNIILHHLFVDFEWKPVEGTGSEVSFVPTPSVTDGLPLMVSERS